MNALNRLKQLLGLPEDAAEETLQAELDKLESLLTPANPAASDLPALPGQPPFPHQADPLPGNARPTLFDFLQACHPQAALTSLVRANTALREQLLHIEKHVGMHLIAAPAFGLENAEKSGLMEFADRFGRHVTLGHTLLRAGLERGDHRTCARNQFFRRRHGVRHRLL